MSISWHESTAVTGVTRLLCQRHRQAYWEHQYSWFLYCISGVLCLMVKGFTFICWSNGLIYIIKSFWGHLCQVTPRWVPKIQLSSNKICYSKLIDQCCSHQLFELCNELYLFPLIKKNKKNMKYPAVGKPEQRWTTIFSLWVILLLYILFQ